MKFRKTTLVLVILLFLGLFSFASFAPFSVSASPYQIEIPPSDVELFPRRVVDLNSSQVLNTTWHELHPIKSRYYNLTSWEPGKALSPGDQIDMINETGGVEWFEVDEVTVDLVVNETYTGIVRWLEYKCGYWVFKKEVEKQPISSKWNEIKPDYDRCWNLTSWEDNGNGKLNPCDTIDMKPMYPRPGPTTYFHVDNVTVTLKLTKKPVEPPLQPFWLEFKGTLDEFQDNDYIHHPVSTLWHEILPVQGRIWHLSSWEDSLTLSPSDQVDLTDEYGIKRWYHVDKLTVAMNMTSIEGLWRIVKFEGSLEQFKKYNWTNPVFTQWHEVNPNYSRQWHLTNWTDTNFDGELSPCDLIKMMDKETGLEEQFHVETLSTDMWLTLKPPPVMYWKANYTDYAPSGIPDFDQRQDLWNNSLGDWTWCAPAAVANSLWWMDSRYENSTTPPPTINDTFPLVSNYTVGIDDHDPSNVPPFIQHLAYLMDTNGIRTGIPHSGTNASDIQAGIAHYLSWTGLNPLGDCNGDGAVDAEDFAIMNASYFTTPGNPKWNMAADIYPVTLGWPTRRAADNIVNINDLRLLAQGWNRSGQFTEQTVAAPDFYFIEDEVEKSEDVTLLLGFWQWTGTDWYREDYPYPVGSGHAVTVAGVNSTTLQIAISDPIQDNAEPPPQGTSGPGRVLPLPLHPHTGIPETLHNNATYVSQDIYNATWISPPLPPNPGGNWTFINYTSPQYPGPWIAVVEWAIIVSPFVGIANVTPYCTVESIYPDKPCHEISMEGYTTWTINITVAVENRGDFIETFNVTANYENATGRYAIGTKTVTLNPGTSAILNFTWKPDANIQIKRIYTISASITGKRVANNYYADGTYKLKRLGDASNDDFVDVDDLQILGWTWQLRKGDIGYRAQADFSFDALIDVDDLQILGWNWQQGC